MTLKKIASLAFLCAILITGHGQETVLEKEVTDKTFNKEQGPNLKKFDHLYVFANAYIEGTDEVEIRHLLSNSFGLGYRYKYKVLSFYNIGFDLGYEMMNYNLKQNDTKEVPNSTTHEKERITFHELDLELYQRFQIGKTGNMIGFFIDLGAFAGLVYGARHIYQDELTEEDPYKAEIRIVKNKKLDYTENLIYGLRGRFGYNNVAICGTYRIADLFKEPYGFKELPRFSIGVQFGLH